MTSIFAEREAEVDEAGSAQLLDDLSPPAHETRMFVSEIMGPQSEEEFAAGWAEVLLPGLSDGQVTASPWADVDGNGFFVQGFFDGDPSVLVADAAQRANWSARTLVLQALRNPIGLPGGRTTDCVMPYNKHAISKADSFKSCGNGHKITDNHAVSRCPVCSKDLK
jgi:hypothetical protein